MVNQTLKNIESLLSNMYAADFKSKSRRNDTHESTTDADARLYRKGNTTSELRAT
jgi:hypothetical protein